MNLDAVQAVGVPVTSTDPVPPARSAPASSSPTQSAAAEVAQNLPQARQYEVNASFGQANLIIYRILDKQTGDLIQQIPPEQLLQIARSIQEMLQAQPGPPSLDVRS